MMMCADCELKAFCCKNMQQLVSDDECCLEHIWHLRYGELRSCPHCKRYCTYHRCKRQKCWQCSQCAYRLSPLAHTIFHKSTTPLSKWFYAMHLINKQQITITQLQQKLDCTYKTAWRMFWKINLLFSKSSLKEYLRSLETGARVAG